MPKSILCLLNTREKCFSNWPITCTIYAMNKDLSQGPISKTLWLYCLPLLGSIILQQVYNLADSVVAGRFISEAALAAVGNATEITLIYTAFAMGCNMGCQVIISQLFGAKNIKGLKTG